MDQEEMKRRTKAFAKKAILLCRRLPNGREGWLTGDQLFRSATSVGSNYRAACRGRSRAEFIAKIGVVIEETDESLYWLEILTEMQLVEGELSSSLMREANELVAILIATVKTARRNKSALLLGVEYDSSQ